MKLKKRRGKQPVKPDPEEALKERMVYLKGKQGSTMNIPMIYRRTFGWGSDSVIFKPVNKRSFVVFRSDISQEENEPKNFVRRVLDVETLPWYPRGRVRADPGDRSRFEELKESLVSLSLTDRYVNVDIPKPENRELDLCLRDDLEYLSGELGYDYSTVTGVYRCTFRFPRISPEEIVNRAMTVLRSTMRVLRDFIEGLLDMDCESVSTELKDISYSVKRAEINMDRIYTDSLNIHWDRPQTGPAGSFLLCQSCERSHDEIEYLVDCSVEMMELMACSREDDIVRLLFEEFISIWRTSIGKAIDRLETAMDTFESGDEQAMETCLTMIREYRKEKQSRTSIQDRSVTDLTTKIEGLSLHSNKNSGMKLLARKECIGSIELLFGMNQSAVRLMDLAKMFATKHFYMERSLMGP